MHIMHWARGAAYSISREYTTKKAVVMLLQLLSLSAVVLGRSFDRQFECNARRVAYAQAQRIVCDWEVLHCTTQCNLITT